MRSSNAAASSACFPLRECPASPILRLVHLGQRGQVIDRARRRPRPSRQARPVVLGINLDPRVRVVAVAVVRVRGVIDRGDVAAPHRRVDPGAVARVVGEEDGERARAVGNHQLDPQRRAAGPVRTPAGRRESSRRLRACVAVTVARRLSGAGGIRPKIHCSTCARSARFCRVHSAGVVTGTVRPSSRNSSGSGRSGNDGIASKSGGSSPVRFSQSSHVRSCALMRPLAGVRLGLQHLQQLVERSATGISSRLSLHRHGGHRRASTTVARLISCRVALLHTAAASIARRTFSARFGGVRL